MKKLLLLLTGVCGLAVAQTQVLADTSLEASGAGGTDWSSTSTNFMTVFCTTASCGNCGGPCAPHTGTYFAWFGGAGAAEVGTLTQTFNVATAGAGDLKFWLMVPNGGDGTNDSLLITLDGVQVYYRAGDDTAGFEDTYKQVTVSLGAVSAGSHTLNIYSVESGNGAGTYNTLIDDVTIEIGGSAGTQTIMLDEHINMFHNAYGLNLQFNLPEASDMLVTIIDMNGRVVFNKPYTQLQNETLMIPTEGLSNGVYNLYMRAGNNSSINRKFVVTH